VDFQVETIYRILANNGYIECITGKGADKVAGYIRQENIEIKSVTDKKLLTLAGLLIDDNIIIANAY
jgi:hypothetical protein